MHSPWKSTELLNLEPDMPDLNLKFKLCALKWNYYFFVNFKNPFTPKNWLLKFGFAYSLAQILEPKLLVHEILKFAWHLSNLTKLFWKF